MYSNVICLCGYPLGDIYELYLAMKNAKLESAEVSNVLPEYAAISADDTDIKEILDALKLSLPCCRARIISNVEFHSIN